MKVVFVLLVMSLAVASVPAHAVRGFGDETVAVRPYVETPSYDFRLKVRTHDGSGVTGRQVIWSPNLRTLSGADVSIGDWIGFGYAGKGPMSNRDRVNKGITDYDDWRLNIAFESIFVLLGFQKYQGFYLQNSSSIDASTGGSAPSIQSSAMKIQNVTASLTYIFHPQRFSLKAAFDNTVRQESSGGSWLVGVGASEIIFSDEQPLIPSQIRSEYGVDQNLIKGRFSAFLVRGGYGHTFVLGRKWFVSLTALLGLGVQAGKSTDTIETRSNNSNANLLDALLSAGYNGDQFFSGLQVIGTTTTYRTTSIEIDSAIYSTKVYIGVRF